MESKTCTKCGEAKPLTEYYARSRKKGEHQAHCKDCHCAQIRAYRQANLEKVNGRRRSLYHANPEKIKARNKAWRQANLEKVSAKVKAWRQANLEKLSAKVKAWRQANPEAYKYSSHKSQAKRRGINHEISFDQFVEAFEKPCHYCGNSEVTGFDRKDSNGHYTMDNCVPCCFPCNTKKGTMEYKLFLEKISLEKDLLKQ